MSNRYGSALVPTLFAAATAIAACANRPAATDDPSPDQPTVQVVESKPLPTPDFELPRETATDTPAPTVSMDDAAFTCSESSECVVLETGCCDHCNGGALVSVNSKYSDAAMEAFRQRSCENTACTKMACAWSFTPVCDAGTCARLEERPLGTAGATQVVVHNSAAATANP